VCSRSRPSEVNFARGSVGGRTLISRLLRGESLKKLIALGLVALWVGGCGTSKSPTTPTPTPPQPETVSPAPAPEDTTGLKVSRLDQLWESRRSGTGEFPIGPGDVITVSVPGLPDLAGGPAPAAAAVAPSVAGAQQVPMDQGLGGSTVRVSSQGYIVLPLVGRVRAGGLSEEQLRDELTQLFGKYMYDPQVELTIQSYNSREVSLSGEVRNPGMYTITRPMRRSAK
jgi:polysaccharide biosynthesis/export protein